MKTLILSAVVALAIAAQASACDPACALRAQAPQVQLVPQYQLAPQVQAAPLFVVPSAPTVQLAPLVVQQAPVIIKEREIVRERAVPLRVPQPRQRSFTFQRTISR